MIVGMGKGTQHAAGCSGPRKGDGGFGKFTAKAATMMVGMKEITDFRSPVGVERVDIKPAPTDDSVGFPVPYDPGAKPS